MVSNCIVFFLEQIMGAVHFIFLGKVCTLKFVPTGQTITFRTVSRQIRFWKMLTKNRDKIPTSFSENHVFRLIPWIVNNDDDDAGDDDDDDDDDAM